MVPDNIFLDVTDPGVVGLLLMTTICNMYDHVSNRDGYTKDINKDENFNNHALVRLKDLVECRDEESHEGYKQLQFLEFNLKEKVVPIEESNIRHGSNEKVRKKIRDKKK